jgi:hypothetical protein
MLISSKGIDVQGRHASADRPMSRPDARPFGG